MTKDKYTVKNNTVKFVESQVNYIKMFKNI